MIELKSASIAYDDAVALKNINLSIKSGEKIGLIGASGAGKTSLLRKIYETVIAEHDSEPGFIHQDFALVDQLSVFHNTYMGKLDQFSFLKNLRNFLAPAQEMQNEIIPLLEKLKLSEKIHTKAGELSGGQKQRLAIARCLYKSPSLILADEPVASIDPLQAETVLNILLNAAPTILISLHNTELALRLCKRIIALREGCIVFDGKPDDLSNTQLTELFKP